MMSDQAQHCEMALKRETITDKKTNLRLPDTIIQKWVFKELARYASEGLQRTLYFSFLLD